MQSDASNFKANYLFTPYSSVQTVPIGSSNGRKRTIKVYNPNWINCQGNNYPIGQSNLGRSKYGHGRQTAGLCLSRHPSVCLSVRLYCLSDCLSGRLIGCFYRFDQSLSFLVIVRRWKLTSDGAQSFKNRLHIQCVCLCVCLWICVCACVCLNVCE